MLADLRQSSALVKVADVLAGLSAAGIAIALTNPHGLRAATLQATASGYATATNVLWLVFYIWSWNRSLTMLGLYARRPIDRGRFLINCMKASCLMAVVLGLCLAAHHAYKHLDKTLLLFITVAMTVECIRRVLLSRLMASAARRPESAIILGTGRRAQRAWRELRISHDQSVCFLGFVDDCDLEAVAPDIRERYLSSVGDLPQFLLHNSVDTLIVATSLRSSFALTHQAVAIAEAFRLRILLLEDTLELGRPSASQQSASVFQELAGRDKTFVYSAACKRIFDLVFAATALLVTAPLWILIYVSVWVTLKRPVLKRERRYGHRRRSFDMLSFQTAPPALVTGTEQTFAVWLGAILRRTYLDRLPTLWNVLVGEMSLVGPAAMETIGPSPLDEPVWANLFTVRPGICGPSNLMARKARGLQQVVEADVRYLQDWSLWSDARLSIKILLMRVLKLDLSMGAAWAASMRAVKRDRAV